MVAPATTKMKILQSLLWIATVQAASCILVFIILPNFSQRLLARMLAVSFMLADLRTSYAAHFRRIMTVPDTPTLPQPHDAAVMEIVPTQNALSRIEEEVMSALINQAAPKRAAREAVLYLRKDGVQSFEQMFRNATEILRCKKRGHA